MDPSAIFEKSSKGVAQLQERSVRLPPIARSALILIDGIKTAGEVAARLGQADKIVEVFAPLVENELIQRKGGFAPEDDKTVAVRGAAGAAAAASPAVIEPVQATAAPVGVIQWGALQQAQIADTRRFMSKFVETKLGFASESFCVRIEGAKNADHLEAEFLRLEKAFVDGKQKLWMDELRQALIARIGAA